jgi:RNA polymerase-binding transcription factor DksA
MPAKKTAPKKRTKVDKTESTQVEPAKKPAPKNGKVAAFTLDDVQSLLKTKKPEEPKNGAKAPKEITKKKAIEEIEDTPQEAKSFGAASLADILGFNPAQSNGAPKSDKKVPRKFKVYYDLLIDLRNHVKDELNLHTRETLKKSIKDDSSDIGRSGQHMADEGTDNFDPDFALSLVSSEQEALSEIQEAIDRIFDGTYGTCEITDEPISKERLLAVPFTKHSLEGQKDLEKNRRFSVQRGGVFSLGIEDSTQYLANDDGD